MGNSWRKTSKNGSLKAEKNRKQAEGKREKDGKCRRMEREREKE